MRGRIVPVEVVFPMCPVYDLEQALPVLPVLDPELLLHAIPKLVITGRSPQCVNYPQILLRNELDLRTQQLSSSNPFRQVVQSGTLAYLIAVKGHLSYCDNIACMQVSDLTIAEDEKTTSQQSIQQEIKKALSMH